MKLIKYSLALIFLMCCNQNYSQTKIDTLIFNYKKKAYVNSASNSIKKLINFNIDLKKDTSIKERYFGELFIDSISNLKIVSIPIFTFKKEILNYKKGENLISYIDFNNDVLNQEILVLKDNEQMYIENISEINNIDYKKVKEEYKSNGYHTSLLYEKNHTRWYLDCLDLTIDNNNLIFKISGNYCIIINGRIYVIFNDSANITLSEFNIHLINYVDMIQQKIKETKLVYTSKEGNNPLPNDKIYLLVKEEE
jgi:hypothetical protein